PFPDVGCGKWQISTAGGTSPQWSRRGDELYFLDGANDMQAIRVTTKPTFSILEKQRLFSANGYFVSPWAQAYDVSPDGKRFSVPRSVRNDSSPSSRRRRSSNTRTSYRCSTLARRADCCST